MLRCRKGDLAILLKGSFCGYIVNVEEFVGKTHYEWYETGLSDCSDQMWRVVFENAPKSLEGRLLLAHDKEMLPIRPGELKETEEQERELHE